VEIRDRRGHLCRFKVRGKRAGEIVASLCEAECVVGTNTEDHAPQMDNGGAESDHEDGFESSQTVTICAKANRLSFMKAARRPSKAQTSGLKSTAAVYSVTVADPRSFPTERPLKPLDAAPDTFSLLKEPTASAIGEVGVNEIISPLTGLSLSSLGKRAEEPEPALILRELSNVLSWTTKAQAEGSSGYPYEAPRLHSDARTTMATIESTDTSEVDTTPQPCSWLWSLSKRESLRRGFRKDHELNADTFRKRKLASRLLSGSTPEPTDREEAATAVESLLHLLVIRQAEPFPDTSGWDLVCSPSMALVLLKALVFRGGMVVGAEEDAAIATVLHSPRSVPVPCVLSCGLSWTNPRLSCAYVAFPVISRTPVRGLSSGMKLPKGCKKSTTGSPKPSGLRTRSSALCRPLSRSGAHSIKKPMPKWSCKRRRRLSRRKLRRPVSACCVGPHTWSRSASLPRQLWKQTHPSSRLQCPRSSALSLRSSGVAT
jgi:hypothetical protein